MSSKGVLLGAGIMLFVIILAGVLLYFFYFKGNVSLTSTTSATTTIAPPSKDFINITITEYKFSPANITYNSLEEGVFKIHNAGNLTHNFYIQGSGGTVNIPRNGTAYYNVSADTLIPGTYECMSTVPGDSGLGLTCQVVVH